MGRLTGKGGHRHGGGVAGRGEPGKNDDGGDAVTLTDASVVVVNQTTRPGEGPGSDDPRRRPEGPRRSPDDVSLARSDRGHGRLRRRSATAASTSCATMSASAPAAMPVTSGPLGDWDRLFTGQPDLGDAKLPGPCHPRMREGNGGSIIRRRGGAGTQGLSGTPGGAVAYTASKAGLQGLTLSVAAPRRRGHPRQLPDRRHGLHPVGHLHGRGGPASAAARPCHCRPKAPAVDVPYAASLPRQRRVALGHPRRRCCRSTAASRTSDPGRADRNSLVEHQGHAGLGLGHRAPPGALNALADAGEVGFPGWGRRRASGHGTPGWWSRQ